MEDWVGETLYFRYAMPEELEYGIVQRSAGRSLLDGLQIAIPMTPNCTAYTMSAEDGSTVQLSDFELMVLPEILDVLTDDVMETEIVLVSSDGTEQQVNCCKAYSGDDGSPVMLGLASGSDEYDPAYTQIFRADEIAAVRINGVTYLK